MGTWIGGIVEKNFDKILLFAALNIWLGAVMFFYIRGADDKVLFFAFGVVNSLVGALLILCNVRKAPSSDTPVTSGTVIESTTLTRAIDKADGSNKG